MTFAQERPEPVARPEPLARPEPFARYVALGDSQTEGLNDPDGRGGFRGWADRFAVHLATHNPHLTYANLAVRGRLIGAIRAEQLGPALAMNPDIATVMGGLNDLMRPSADPDVMAADLDAVLSALTEHGCLVLTNTFPDPSAIAPLFTRLAPRVRAYNDRVREVAAARHAIVVDFDAHGAGTDMRIWSPDRIHANPLGHSLIAAAFADTCGLEGFSEWAQPLPPLVAPGFLRRTGADARWLGREVAPWLLRRARGRSSGDGITAKRPALLPVASIFHLVRAEQWIAGQTYRPASLAREGFIHYSFHDQVARSANVHYADAGNLLAVEVDAVALAAPVPVERSATSTEAFPHGYGALPPSAVIAVHPMSRDSDGQWQFSPVRAVGAASPDR